MDITAVLILITTDEEMKKKNTGIAVKEVQLERDFSQRDWASVCRFPE